MTARRAGAAPPPPGAAIESAFPRRPTGWVARRLWAGQRPAPPPPTVRHRAATSAAAGLAEYVQATHANSARCGPPPPPRVAAALREPTRCAVCLPPDCTRLREVEQLPRTRAPAAGRAGGPGNPAATYDGVPWGAPVAELGPTAIRPAGTVTGVAAGAGTVAVTAVDALDDTHALCATTLALDVGAGVLSGARLVDGAGRSLAVRANGVGPA